MGVKQKLGEVYHPHTLPLFLFYIYFVWGFIEWIRAQISRLNRLNPESMDLAATKEKYITTRKRVESGNKSSIVYHPGGRGFAEALATLGEKRECKPSTAIS